MLISVIVAVYNIEAYIGRCIESILAQTCKELEVILVDDGSTDSSGEICESFAAKDERVTVIHQKNGGLSAARNTGIERAGGEYIAFVDGDDWIEPGMYERMASLAREHTADLVACRYKCIYKNSVKDDSTGEVTVYEEPYTMLLQYLREDERFLIQHAAWNKLYSRQLLGTERFPVGKWYEDAVFSAKMLSNVKRGIYVDQAYYNYVCEREDSIMNAGMTERIFTDMIPAFLEKEDYLKTLPVQEPVRIHRFQLYKRLLLFYLELYEKENKPFRRYGKWIISLLKEHRSTFEEVYSIPEAGSSDRMKIKLFMISPVLFRVFMKFNNKVILPMRLKRMESKSC